MTMNDRINQEGELTYLVHNPWLSIWTAPKITIRQIVSYNPTEHIILLAALYGINRMIYRVEFIDLVETLGGLLAFILATIIGSTFGIVVFYIYSAMLKWTGGWLNGQATGQEIRAAYAWSNVPYVLMMLLFLVDVFMLQPMLSSNGLASSFVLNLDAVFLIWSTVILSRGLAEVQGFSAWTGFGNALLASVMTFPLLLGFVMIVRALFLIVLPSAY